MNWKKLQEVYFYNLIYKKFKYKLKLDDIKNKLNHLINSIFRDKSLTKKILSNQRQYSDKNVLRNLNIELEQILNEKN